MGQPAAVSKVNGTKRQSQPSGLRPGETRMPPEQFWTEWLQAFKRHIEDTQAGGGNPRRRGDGLGPEER